MDVFDTDPTGWRPTTWALYALGALHVLATAWFWFAFQLGERRARRGDPMAVARYNRMLRGFPNAVYSKMLGKKPYDLPRPEPGRVEVS